MESVKFVINIIQVGKGLNVIPIFSTGRKGLNLSSLFKAGNLTIISLGAKGLKVLPSFTGTGSKRVKSNTKVLQVWKGLNLSLILYKWGKG